MTADLGAVRGGKDGCRWRYPFTRTDIKATGEPRPDAGGPFWDAADRAMASPAWSYREIATNHMIPSSRPEELAGLLLELT